MSRRMCLTGSLAVLVVGVGLALFCNPLWCVHSGELLSDAQLALFRGGDTESGIGMEAGPDDDQTCYGENACQGCSDAYGAAPTFPNCPSSENDYENTTLEGATAVPTNGMGYEVKAKLCWTIRSCAGLALQLDSACDPCSVEEQCAPYYWGHQCRACEWGADISRKSKAYTEVFDP